MKDIARQTRRQFIKVGSMTAGVFLLGVNFARDVYAEVKDAVQSRFEGIYKQDAAMKLRKSQDNPEVKAIYKDFLKEPLGEESEKLLHTEYHDRSAKIKALEASGIKLKMKTSLDVL